MSNQSLTIEKCPFCAEEIQMEAIKCKHCGEWLSNKEDLEKALGSPQSPDDEIRLQARIAEEEKAKI